MPVNLGLPTTLRKRGRGCDLGTVIATAAAAAGRVLDDLRKA